MEIILGIVCVAAVAAGVYFIMKKRGNMSLLPVMFPVTEVELLKMEDILFFFKSPEVISELKKNSDLVACVTREEKDGSIFVTSCIFDKNKNEISDIEKNGKIWKAGKLDDRLTEAFGDKEMIILN